MDTDESPEQHAGVSVTDDGVSRYEARTAEGEVVGFAEYDVRGETVVFPHTVVDPAHRGQGIAGALARRALDDARAAGRSVVPACGFFQVYLRRHPRDQDLVA